MEGDNSHFFSSNTPIKDLIKEKSYYANTIPFNNISNDTTTNNEDQQKDKDNEQIIIHPFKLLFPSYIKFIDNYDNDFSLYLKSKPEAKLDVEARLFVRHNIANHDNEISEFIGQDWINLFPGTKVHTTLFFILAYMETPFSFNDYDKNILYWTILFHDIGKHQILNPNYEEVFKEPCVDKMHPFKSVYILLKAFLHNHYIYFGEDINAEKDFIEHYDKFIDVLFKSYTSSISNKTQQLQYNLSYEHIEDLQNFLLFLREKKENRWVYDITILILFHQSLPNNEEKMNKPLLDEQYIIKLFDLRLIEMMRVVMVYDSCSHSLFKGGKWVEAINENLDKLRLLFK